MVSFLARLLLPQAKLIGCLFQTIHLPRFHNQKQCQSLLLASRTVALRQHFETQERSIHQRHENLAFSSCQSAGDRSENNQI